jgi:hypothetical protein
MKIGVVACNILQRELDKLLSGMRGIEEVVYLDGALHVSPLKMKETIRAEVDKLGDGSTWFFSATATASR